MPRYLATTAVANSHPDNRGLKALWVDPPGSGGVTMEDRFRGLFNLSPTNAPSRTLSPFGGGAFLFNSASFRYFSSASAVVSSLPVAVCAWVYTFSHHNGTIWDCRRASGGFTGFSLSPRLNGAVRWYQNGGTGRTLTTPNGVLPIATWTRVAGVGLSSTDYRIYINGVKVSTGANISGTVYDTTSATNIGRYQAGDGSGEFFNGLLSDIRVWGGSEFSQSDMDSFIARDYRYSQRLGDDPRLIQFSRISIDEVIGGGGAGAANNLLLLGAG